MLCYCVVLFLTHTVGQAAISPQKGHYFIENAGQLHKAPQVLFTAQQGNNSILFTTTGLSYITRQRGGRKLLSQHRVNLDFIGAQPQTKLVGMVPLSSYSNFYSPKKGSAEKAQHFAALVYKNVYPHIDLKYFFTTEGAIKYEFIVHPSGEPRHIRIAYSGMEGALLINEKGILEIATQLGSIEEAAPYSFQTKETEVPRAYQLDGNVLSFKVGAYNLMQDLVIDPY